MDDVVALVRRSLDDQTADAFRERVAAQAGDLSDAFVAGRFDNDDFAVGLEIETYAIMAEPEPIPADAEESDEGVEGDEETPPVAGEDVTDGEAADRDQEEWADEFEQLESDDADPSSDRPDDGDDLDEPVRPEPYMDPDAWEGRVAPIPEAVFDHGVAKELGVHNAEVNTNPSAFDATGLEVQTTAVEMQVKKAREAAADEHRELILDAMWTIPPEAGAGAYLSAVEDHDGVTVAENMRQDPRYVAIDNDVLGRVDGGLDLSVPGVDRTFPSILFESLTSSIQPHLQIPDLATLQNYYNAAIRTMGPVLALTTNSPFLPADLYREADADPGEVCERTHQELRVAVFEQSVNATPNPKVRVPEDVTAATDVLEGVVEDDLFAPFLREWIEDGPRNTLAEQYWEFDHKRGTYWRWLRAVVGGDAVDGAGDEASVRIEYRPIPTQPTTADVVATQVLVVGLIRGIGATGHPLADLDWADARDAFYAAASDGLDADLVWLTADGERTTDHDRIYAELFDLARAGLEAQGVPAERANEYLEPLVDRYDAGVTPADWKIGRVREELDAGATFTEALATMQREYYERSRESDSFVDWLPSE